MKNQQKLELLNEEIKFCESEIEKLKNKIELLNFLKQNIDSLRLEDGYAIYPKYKE